MGREGARLSRNDRRDGKGRGDKYVCREGNITRNRGGLVAITNVRK